MHFMRILELTYMYMHACMHAHRIYLSKNICTYYILTIVYVPYSFCHMSHYLTYTYIAYMYCLCIRHVKLLSLILYICHNSQQPLCINVISNKFNIEHCINE